MSSFDYRSRLKELSARYNPEASILVNERMQSEDHYLDTDVVRYVKRSMRAVDDDYTKRTKDAGEAVKQHLNNELINVTYEYQGSVMTNTHIKGASDIDLLVICEKFEDTEINRVRECLKIPYGYSNIQLSRLRNYELSFSLYRGDSREDLSNLRRQIESIMISKYTICDISKAKSVRITNQHLHRDVDIVTSSWFQSLEYVLDGMPKEEKGIKIYNKNLGFAEGPDFPFLSISRINQKSSESNGRLKRMIRFLKNVRTDSQKDIQLTSFDINAICYSIPVADYAYLDYKQLVYLLWSTMYHLWYDNKLDKLKSVVGDEYVFKGKPNKIEALKALEDDVFKIHQDLN